MMHTESKLIPFRENIGNLRIARVNGKAYLAVDRYWTFDGYELSEAEASQLVAIFDRLASQPMTRDIGGALDANPWGASAVAIAQARES